jgi:hypothetical protein
MIVSWLFAMALASFGQAPPLRPALLDPKTVEAISTDEFRQLIARHAAKGEQRGDVLRAVRQRGSRTDEARRKIQGARIQAAGRLAG